jgi:hypothetical protein
MLPGSRGHIDFGEQFPYDPEKAKALLDPDTMARASDPRAGHHTISHDDAPVDVLIDFLQAARASVKGYEHLHRFMIRFETTRLDKP